MKEIQKPDKNLIKILPKVKLSAEKKYIPSRYVIAFDHNGKNYLFNNLTKHIVEGTLPSSAKAGECYDDLIMAMFLVPEEKDECLYYNSISNLMRTFSYKKGIRSYTILPTLGCNARCIYCYEEGLKQVTMTPEIVEQTIKYIIDTHEKGDVKLAWFGGEPLLGEKTIDRICEGLVSAGLNYTSTMISNGSLITSKLIDKMKVKWNLKRIQISMDGYETDYKYRKNYYEYQDYYHTVMESISQLSEKGIHVSIRCNVDENNWEDIPRFVDDIKTFISCKDNVGIYFAPLNDVRMGSNDLTMWKKILDAYDLLDISGFRYGRFKGFSLKFRINHCMADNEGIVISPDGTIYSCEHWSDKCKIGDIYHGITNEQIKKEFSRVDKTRDKCRDCPFLPDCTSFSSCPVEDMHCREVHELIVKHALIKLLERNEEISEEDIIC